MQQSYRANLGAAEFPFLTELQGRNVIVMGPDQNFSRQANSPKNKDKDVGIPQIYYMHNVMPTDAGVSTVAYQNITNAPADTDGNFIKIYTLRDINENTALLGITSTGRCYICIDPVSGWLRTTDKAPATGRQVTTAHVNGQTYICFGGVGTFKYNFGTNALDAVTLNGLVAAQVMGICASSGYMVAWTDTAVQWSSLLDPTDFVPSLVSGAGGGGIQLAKAAITMCLPQNNGFIVYTKRNAIAAFYTNNTQFPFTYKEIMGAGGVANINLVAFDGNSTDHYAYTTAGLQDISMNNASVIFPQVTDFVAGGTFEDFNETTLLFTQVQLSAVMQKKVTLIANRYLVVSYGINTYTHALVYDFALARWGKLKVTHTDCFEYFLAGAGITETPKRSIGFLTAEGLIKVVVMSYATTGSAGVIIAGKYQLDRDHMLGLQELHLESVKAGNILAVSVLTTIDGLNATTSIPSLIESNTTYRRYHVRKTGLNHSIVVSGAFHLNSLVLKYSQAGLVR